MVLAVGGGHTGLCGGSDGQWYTVDFPHDVLVRFVHLHKHPGFCRQLSLDVGGGKNTLQVQPVPLAVQPLILGRIKDFVKMYIKDVWKGSKILQLKSLYCQLYEGSKNWYVQNKDIKHIHIIKFISIWIHECLICQRSLRNTSVNEIKRSFFDNISMYLHLGVKY